MLPDPRPYFANLSAPRREPRNQLHKRSDILMIVFCAVLSGVDAWMGREELATPKERWWRKFLELPNGIPSHDTLSDVFGRLKPGAFAEAFLRWVQVAVPSLAGEQVCLEGKTRRGNQVDEHAVHLLRASAAQARWVLAPQAVADKTNEITTIPEWWSLLEVEGALVSIDAIGCPKTSARDIIDAGADEVLALNDNPPHLCEDVRWWRETAAARGRLRPQEPVEKAHGRLDIRR